MAYGREQRGGWVGGCVGVHATGASTVRAPPMSPCTHAVDVTWAMYVAGVPLTFGHCAGCAGGEAAAQHVPANIGLSRSTVACKSRLLQPPAAHGQQPGEQG
jgi:hypothetical protein